MKPHFIIALFLITGFSQATTLTVCPSGCDFAGIQNAIDAANEGDVIEVHSGSYPEQIVIYKNISLQGIDTGNGTPSAGVVYLGNHSVSVIHGIVGAIMLFGYPSPNIVVVVCRIFCKLGGPVIPHLNPYP